eukprot:353967-Chlamydomonas_euryale.AAC.4
MPTRSPARRTEAGSWAYQITLRAVVPVTTKIPRMARQRRRRQRAPSGVEPSGRRGRASLRAISLRRPRPYC